VGSAVGKPINKPEIDFFDPFSLYKSELYGFNPFMQGHREASTICDITCQPGPIADGKKFHASPIKIYFTPYNYRDFDKKAQKYPSGFFL